MPPPYLEAFPIGRIQKLRPLVKPQHLVIYIPFKTAFYIYKYNHLMD